MVILSYLPCPTPPYLTTCLFSISAGLRFINELVLRYYVVFHYILAQQPPVGQSVLRREVLYITHTRTHNRDGRTVE